MKSAYSERPVHPPLVETFEAVIAVLILVCGSLAWYVVHNRYHYTNRQIEEIFLYLLISGASIWTGVWLLATRRSRREKEWPHPPLVLSPKRDERFTQRAWRQDSVVLGYDIHGKPWFWPDKVRVMQGIVLGMTGAGKTTLLRNIITQDLARFVGTPEEQHHLPMVIFDGKGDLQFFYDLLPHIHRAGRLHQLRVLNPASPTSLSATIPSIRPLPQTLSFKKPCGIPAPRRNAFANWGWVRKSVRRRTREMRSSTVVWSITFLAQ